MYDQAKWYVLYFNDWVSYGNPIEDELRKWFKECTFIYLLVNDHGLRRGSIKYNKLMIFCGKKKLKKLIEEAHLLGLEDELLIFERKRRNESNNVKAEL